jgi:SAM-dependent methyltransferase
MKEMWDKRYGAQEYAYGTSPNEFFRQSLEKHQAKGKILLPGEGEGRNAVYAAKKGLDVFAFDISNEGKKKALALAEKESVSIHYEVANFLDISLKENDYDLAALIFTHLPAELLHACHRKVASAIKTGGLIIIEAFHFQHQECQNENPNAGGPKDVNMLFTKNTIARDFPNFSPIILQECEVNLSEGEFHQGRSKVLRYVGKKN